MSKSVAAVLVSVLTAEAENLEKHDLPTDQVRQALRFAEYLLANADAGFCWSCGWHVRREEAVICDRCGTRMHYDCREHCLRLCPVCREGVFKVGER